MTRPVYEPSLTRKDTSLQWGSNQLFRRPAPRGAEYPYVFRKHTAGQTIGPGNIENISWDSSDFSQAAGFFTPDDNISFNIIGPGVFDFVCGAVWDTAFNSKTMLQVQCNAFGNFPSQLGWGGFYDDGGTLLDSAQSFFIHFQARVASGTSPTAIGISQANAAGKDLFEAFFRVAHIIDWTPGTGAGSEADFVFL